MESTNEHYLRITDKVNIPHSLEVDHEYQFTGTISTYGADKRSKQDGTFSYTHKARFDSEIFLVKGEQVIRAKDNKRWSQKLRHLVYGKGHEYDRFMPYLLSRMDEIFSDYETYTQEAAEDFE